MFSVESSSFQSTLAPPYFKKIVAVVAAHLQTQSIRLALCIVPRQLAGRKTNLIIFYVKIERELPDSDCLHMDTLALSTSWEKCLCMHTYELSVPKGLTKHNTISVLDYSDCGTVASQTLVNTFSTTSGCLLKKTTVKSQLSKRQLSKTTGIFEDDAQYRLFFSIIYCNKTNDYSNFDFRSDSSVPIKEIANKLLFKIPSPNVTYGDHDFFVWSSLINTPE